MTHPDPENPKKNPRPVKRYEMTATVDPSYKWDAMSGGVTFDVVNLECTPKNTFLGVHVKPTDVSIEFKMDRVDEKTWKGYFYRDSMLDEDYYELGVCHWDATSVGASFVAHGETFGTGDIFEDILKNGSHTEYFKKSEYLDRSFTGDQALVSAADTPEVVQNPHDYFPITITVKEVAP